MWDTHLGGGILKRQHAPLTTEGLPMCTISGIVLRNDGTPVQIGTVTFDSRVPQVIAGVTVQPLIVSRCTNHAGQLQALSLAQGLFVQVVVHDNGISYPPAAAVIPFASTATLDQLLQGIVGTPAPGLPGPPGADGAPGADGLTPHIGANGNWWLGASDTGVPASGGGIGDAPTTGAVDGYLRNGLTGSWQLITVLDCGLY